jgi:serine/threonine protein kinase
MKLWRYGHAIERLGQRYRLEGVLGSGGMADVCLAWDEHEACEVAIKVIKPDQLEQRTLDRFIKEAAQVARWKHPNILHVYSDLKLELLNAAQGSIVPYIVMEYAQGGDLHKRLTPGEPYPFAATLDLFVQLCSAVAYAHEHGIIHRDLKPLNILFRKLPGGGEQVVLSDFGMAVEIDATHHTFADGGTPLYMAPEQRQGRAQPASDIFALGVIFYQLCTGRLPFRSDRSTAPVLPSIFVPTLPPALDNVILKALAPDPALRFSTASDFWDAIQAVIYNNHLKPTPSTPQQDHSNPTDQNQHPAPTDLNSLPAQQVVVADSQKPPMPIPNPVSQMSQPVPPQPVNQIKNSNIDLSNHSYSHGIQTNNPQSVRSQQGSTLKLPPRNGAASSKTPHPPRDSRKLGTAAVGSVVTASAAPAHNAPSSSQPPTSGKVGRGAGAVSGRPRRNRPWWIVALLILGVLFVLFSMVFSLAYAYPKAFNFPVPSVPGVKTSSLATVTITSDSKVVDNDYVIVAIPNGVPNADQHQISARTLSSQQTQTGTVTGTGHNQVPATTARGSLTFLNGSFASSFTVATNIPIPAGGISVYLDVPAVIPAGNSATGASGTVTVPAYAATPGAAGNIAAQTISGTCCVAGGSVQVHNSNAFTGGQDAKDYNFVQQGDVDAFVSTTKAQLTQQANSALKGQLKSGEQLAQATNCPSTFQSSNQIGDQGVNIPTSSVTVTVTCKAEAFDQNGMNALAANLLQQKAKTELGTDSANYTEQGTPIIRSQVQQINADQSVSLIVTARGLWIYQFSNDQKLQLAKLIAGKTSDAAKTLLTAQMGVQDATISTNKFTLPTDPSQISIMIQGIPNLQDTGAPAYPTFQI